MVYGRYIHANANATNQYFYTAAILDSIGLSAIRHPLSYCHQLRKCKVHYRNATKTHAGHSAVS